MKMKTAESMDSQKALLLEDGESNEEHFLQPQQSLQYHRSRFNPFHAIGGIIAAISIFLLGFYGGWQMTHHFAKPVVFLDAAPRVSIGTVQQTFHQDTRFMAPPPPHGEPEVVWDSMLPIGLGYVRSPDISATRNVSTVSAMHQLHCLYTIRRIYFSEVTKSSMSNEGMESFDNGVDRADHMAHCFEYLRQAIMCSADSTLEPFETPNGGFPGMGFVRQCRDYGALKVFAERWRIMDEKSFIVADAQHKLPLEVIGQED